MNARLSDLIAWRDQHMEPGSDPELAVITDDYGNTHRLLIAGSNDGTNRLILDIGGPPL